MHRHRFQFFVAPLLVAHVLGCESRQVANRELCTVSASGTAAGASADICAQLARRWSLLFAERIPPGAMYLAPIAGMTGTITDSQWTLMFAYPTRDQPAQSTRPSDGVLELYAKTMMPHEGGHKALDVLLAKPGASAPLQYGSRFPDWFDEAVAVWMEARDARANRFRGSSPPSVSLAHLVTIIHPTVEATRDSDYAMRPHQVSRTVTPPCVPKCMWLPDSLQRKYQVLDVNVGARGKDTSIVWYADHDPTAGKNSPEERAFYPLSYALLRFIRIRGGTAAITELMNRYRKDPTPRTEVFARLPGLPATFAEFDKAWHAFLTRLPPEDE